MNHGWFGYRLGDVVRLGEKYRFDDGAAGAAWQAAWHELDDSLEGPGRSSLRLASATAAIWPTSIASLYARFSGRCGQPYRKMHVPLLRSIVERRCLHRDMLPFLPNRSTVVIHIRIGDLLQKCDVATDCAAEMGKSAYGSLYTPHAAFDRVVAALERYEAAMQAAADELMAGANAAGEWRAARPTDARRRRRRLRVTIVAGVHRLTDDQAVARHAYAQSEAYLDIVVQKLRSAGFASTVQSRSPDTDFCTMTLAPVLFASKSGFSRMASEVARELGNIVVSAEEIHAAKTSPAAAGFDRVGQPLVGEHQPWPPPTAVIIRALAANRGRREAAAGHNTSVLLPGELEPDCGGWVYRSGPAAPNRTGVREAALAG